MSDLPFWNREEYPPLINHRSVARLEANPIFTRICFVDVPPLIQSLDGAIELYSSEQEELLGHGIDTINQARVLIRIEDVAANNLLGMPAVKNQHVVHGHNLLPEGCFLGTTVHRIPIEFDIESDTVADALQAYTVEAIESHERRFMIGDLRANQVTCAQQVIADTPGAVGLLFDTDLVLYRTFIN
ncbi:MAG: hypothetical protein KIH63_002030 [Candidatus Saccharibacteria bacterium]|nr:hypothetical protein [Candidatus Saccharibacteria bacterium]